MSEAEGTPYDIDRFIARSMKEKYGEYVQRICGETGYDKEEEKVEEGEA